jgi:hypothetical protein
MKTLIIFLALFWACIIQASAQFTNISEFTVNGEKFFIAPALYFDNATQWGYRIYHSKSPISNLEQPEDVNYPSQNCFDDLVNKVIYNFEENQADLKRFYDVARSVFPPSRLANIPENIDADISLVLITTPRGQIKEINYYLRLNNPYTQQEIALLDRLLKQNMYLTYPRRHSCEGINHFIFDLEIDGYDIRAIHSDPYYFGLGEYWQEVAETLKEREELRKLDEEDGE